MNISGRPLLYAQQHFEDTHLQEKKLRRIDQISSRFPSIIKDPLILASSIPLLLLQLGSSETLESMHPGKLAHILLFYA